MSFQISSYDNQLVKYNVRFFCYLVLLQRKKKSNKRVSDKTAPKGRKGREGTFGGWAGVFS